ncbi:MAG: hypothetical protein IJW46_01695 [Clostridia bacterium]|nr:hypothetical protein [Clostridia bacterium]
MPNMHLYTGLTLDQATKDEIKAAFAEAIALIPGKSERWLMVIIEDGVSMYLAGSDAPAAMVSVELLGSASGEIYERVTAHVTRTLHRLLKLPPDRIYTKYSEYRHWGWNGEHF